MDAGSAAAQQIRALQRRVGDPVSVVAIPLKHRLSSKPSFQASRAPQVLRPCRAMPPFISFYWDSSPPTPGAEPVQGYLTAAPAAPLMPRSIATASPPA